MIEQILDLSTRDVNFRKNLPVGLTKSSYERSDQMMKALLGSLQKNISVEKGFHRFLDELIADKSPNLSGQLKQVSSLQEITLNSVALKRSNVVYKIMEGPEKVIIQVFGQDIEFPLFTKPAIDHVNQNQKFKVSELPDCMDDKGKVVFMMRLVKEGIVQITSY